MEDKLKYFTAVIKYYLRIWLMMSKNSMLAVLSQKKLLLIFLLGKILRFAVFLIFLIFILQGTNTLSGYSVNQIIFFFLTFNFIDIVSQFMFREVYRFRPLLVSGDFDLVLVKPYNALFRVLMGGADIIDFITIIPLVAAMIYVGGNFNPSVLQIIVFTVLIINGMIIATAFHIATLAFGIITMEIDHMIMIFRDITNLGRLPVDIYRQPLQAFLTYLIPVGIMISLPAKAFFGYVNITGILISFVVTILFLIISFKFWKYSLKYYSSASS